MQPKLPIIFIGLLLGWAILQAAPATPAGSNNPHADFVLVLNTNPANPLGGEIWLMDLNGRLSRRITKNNYHEEYPSFSPDGTRIAFVRNMGGILPGGGLDPKNSEIFIYDLRGGIEARLTHNNVEDGHPEWSFDGRSIAFHSGRGHPEGKTTLWIMGVDGSDPRQITTLNPGDLSHFHPSWGPDGQWLAFVNYREENSHRYARIEKVRLNGSQRTVVSSGGKYLKASLPGKDEPRGDLEPVHSPEGAMIWVSRRLEAGLTRLFSFSAGAYYGGKAETEMGWPVHPEGAEQSPRFSPDGRRVLLTRLSSKAGIGTRQLVLTDPQSSFRRYLTSREDWDVWHPNWHPFSRSRAEQEEAGKLASYHGSPVASRILPERNGEGQATNSQLPESGVVRPAAGAVELAGRKVSPVVAYEIRWMLDWPPDDVSSLTFRYQGKFQGKDETGRRSVGFQLMDWESNRWVTVFVRSGISAEVVRVQHEIAPANFISRDQREVALRIITTGAPALMFAGPEPLQLSMDVKRLDREG
jgi:dipeptidyl aminopeptidase/acylaminoacyl peptidase